MPGCYFVHAQDDLNQCILCMFEGTFLLGMVHVINKLLAITKTHLFRIY